MNAAEHTARVLHDVLRDIAQPELKPRCAPVRRNPLKWFTYTVEDLKLWTLEIGYRWSKEPEDDYEIEIVEVDQHTPAGRTALDPSCLHNDDRLRIEEDIKADLHAQLEAERDDRGDYEYEARKDRDA